MNPSALAALEQFRRHLALERALSAHTVAAYTRDLSLLAAFCERQGIQDWRALTAADVRRFGAGEHRRGLSAKSIQRLLAAVRCLLNFLIRERVLDGNVAIGIQAPRTPKRLPHVLDVDQVTQLLDIGQYRDQDPHAVRDKAIMELLYSSALRVTELVQLNCADVDLAAGEAWVLGKGSKERVVPVGSYAIAAIQAWLPIRDRTAKAGEPALFVGRYGRRLGQRNIQLRIAHWAKVRKIPIPVYPHIFRHSCATHLLEGAGDIRHVQEFLGHASISTTQIYTHLDFAHLAKVYDAAHPRGGMNPAERAKRLPPEKPSPSKPRAVNVSLSLDSIGPSPCDNCPHAERCAAERLACSAFEAFFEGAPESQWRSVQNADATAERYQRLSET